MQDAELRIAHLKASHDTKDFSVAMFLRVGSQVVLVIAAAIVLGVFVWQGVTAKGAPDPTKPHTSQTVALLDIGVLVFREGLECILVLSAITASMVGTHSVHRRPIAAGAGVGFIATLITWFIAVGIVGACDIVFYRLGDCEKGEQGSARHKLTGGNGVLGFHFPARGE